jgi:hypothetical protein
MATVVSCPNCRRRGTVPENMIGQKIRCRNCGEIFLAISDGDTDPSLKKAAPKPAAPPVPEDPDDMLL